MTENHGSKRWGGGRRKREKTIPNREGLIEAIGEKDGKKKEVEIITNKLIRKRKCLG